MAQDVSIIKSIQGYIRNISTSIAHCELYLWQSNGQLPTDDTGSFLKIHRIDKDDLDGRFLAYRGNELILDRLDSGYIGYWFEYDGAFVHAHWYAKHLYEVWDIRSILLIPDGSLYIFDGYTVPEYRGRGILRYALAGSLLDMCQLKATDHIFALTQSHNASINVALPKIGYQRKATLSFRQFPPCRYHGIQGEGKTRHYMTIMHLRNESRRFDLSTMSYME
jgi:GNAT superfamily N-acetyltransferase